MLLAYSSPVTSPNVIHSLMEVHKSTYHGTILLPFVMTDRQGNPQHSNYKNITQCQTNYAHQASLLYPLIKLTIGVIGALRTPTIQFFTNLKLPIIHLYSDGKIVSCKLEHKQTLIQQRAMLQGHPLYFQRHMLHMLQNLKQIKSDQTGSDKFFQLESLSWNKSTFHECTCICL